LLKLGSGPPPPPGFKGPPGPPPPPGFPGGFATSSPELPEYLKKKAKREVDVPLKKIAWTSATPLPIESSKAITTDTKGPPKKRVKRPLVISDDKMLQALEDSLRVLELDEEGRGIKTVPVDPFVGCNWERFAATLASINALPARLDSLIFMLRFNETLNDLKPGISAVIEACDEVRTSVGFAMFLEMVLLVGNYMGHSSKTYKDTFAFEMSVLTKLTDTKDVDNNETLLHHLVLQMSQQANGAYVQFPIDDFMHIAKASRVNPDEMAKGVAALKNGIRKSGIAVRREKLGPFLEKAKAEYDIVEKVRQYDY
uniref:FH2 domain-containing protein n=1 Tax=Parascaris equorum TaxID=6256 RepID=A0A914R842_PAREQ